MKASELMIGDWVKFPIGNEKIIDLPYIEGKGICASFSASATLFPVKVEKLKPIPLTSEILEKNFREYLPGINLMYQLKGPYFAMNEEGNQWVFGLVREDGERSRRYPLVKITYIHELQHALKLCGIEKEIVI